MNQIQTASMPVTKMIRLKRLAKRFLLPTAVDALMVVVAFLAVLSLRQPEALAAMDLRLLYTWMPLVVVTFVLANFGWHIYGRLWQYASGEDILALAKAAGLATLALFLIDMLPGHPLPYSHVLMVGMLSFSLMSLVRFRHRLWTDRVAASQRTVQDRQADDRRIRVLIVGAGAHGRRVAQHLRSDEQHQPFYNVLGFIDDDPVKLGMRIAGIKVLGDRYQIPSLVRELAIDQIVIASRGSFGDTFEELVDICQESSAQIKLMPRYNELFSPAKEVSDLRDLTIEDLLERTPMKIDELSCRQVIAGRVVLVTGAAGSIGSELCRQLVHLGPKRLVLVDNNETGLHELHLELQEALGPMTSVELRPFLGDVTNRTKLRAIFQASRPEIVFHAAAYKHVPQMEINPDESIRVNVLGTVNLVELSDHFGVDRFILISTDKAVNPSCVMGASKRLGELWIAARQQRMATRLAAVRFGNVVGSRGSVVPLFQRQIERGGPVTVTDPRMTRYFMSIPEAASLIIQAGAFAKGGEIFMLDMGEPISIVNLAKKMIRLKGLRPGIDIPIKFIGIRPGEKLHEELSYQVESKQPTPHPKIYSLGNQGVPDPDYLAALVDHLDQLIRSEEWDPQELAQTVLQAAREAAPSAPQAQEQTNPVAQEKQPTPLWWPAGMNGATRPLGNFAASGAAD